MNKKIILIYSIYYLMEFEVDVSGEDVFSKNYTIVVADRNEIVRGYKFDEKTIKILKARHGEGRYRYGNSRQDKALMRVRVYCVVIYYLFKNLLPIIADKRVTINLCRDFQGHEKDITSYLLYFLGNLLGLKIEIRYVRLDKGSNADKYAFLMRMDKKNLIDRYVKISIDEIEKFLK